MSASSASPFTYRAFISYSHRDKASADWLHKALETYRVPSRLVGSETAHGKIPRRLIPIFRDRDELASANSLAEKVNAALAQSENLIVICSPGSAASRWVNEEVSAYKRAAKAQYEAALNIYARWRAREPSQTRWQTYLGNEYDSLGKLALERGKLDEAITGYREDQRIKTTLAERNPSDHQAQTSLLVSNAILGRTLGWCGDLDDALQFTARAVDRAKSLMAFDPTYASWQDYYGLYSQQLGGLLRQAGQLDGAAKTDGDAVRVLSALTEKDPTSSDWPTDLAQAQLETARLQLARNDMAGAGRSATTALTVITKLRSKMPDDRGLVLLDAQSDLLLGRIATQRHDGTIARQDWTRAQKLLAPTLQAGNDPTFLAAYAEALLDLGQMDLARPSIDKLNAMGFRTPDFVVLLAGTHIDYPVNATFQNRLAQIMQPGVAEGPHPPGAPGPASVAH